MSSVSTSSSSQQNSEDFAASQYRYDEQGRRYHNRSDAAYILPNDDEGIYIYRYYNYNPFIIYM